MPVSLRVTFLGMGRRCRSLFLSLLICLPIAPVRADNGQVGIATRWTDPITVDGVLDDWPENLPEYQISTCRTGDLEPGDFEARFRALWNDTAGMLFLAVEIDDDALTPYEQGTLFLDARHDRGVQGVLTIVFPKKFGKLTSPHDKGSDSVGPGIQVAATEDTEAGHRTYEWQIPLGETAGFNPLGYAVPVIGLGFDFRDYDGRDDKNYISWGSPRNYLEVKSSIGDLVLAPPGLETGSLELEFSEFPHPDLPRLLDLYLDGASGKPGSYLTVGASTSQEIPAGDHYLVPSWDGEKSRRHEVQVFPDKTTQLSISLPPVEPVVSAIDWNRTPLIAPPPINRDEFYSYGVTQGFFSTPGTGIAEDPHGGIWISGLSGITYMTNNNVRSLPWRQIPLSDGYRGIAANQNTGTVCVAETTRISIIRNRDTLTEYGLDQGVALSWSRKFMPIPVLADRDGGGFWIGQDDGLLHISEDFTFSKESAGKGRVSNVAMDRDGTIWIASSDGLHQRIGENEFRHVPVEMLNREVGVTALTFDPDGSIWIGVGGAPDILTGHLVRLNAETMETVTVEPGVFPPYRKITHLSCDVDSSGRKLLHIGISESPWFYRFQIEESAAEGPSLRLLCTAQEAGNIKDTLLDRFGKTWVVGSERVLASSPIQPYDPYFPEEAPSKHTVNDFVMKHDTGALWCATSRGVIATYPTPLVFGKKEGLPTEKVMSILEDSEGTIWAGTGEGVAVLEDGRFRTLADTDGLDTGEVCCLAEGADGDMWAGTQSGLIRIGKDGSREGFLHKHPITSLIYAGDGSLFFAESWHDIYHLRDGKVERIEGYDAFSVTCFARDGEGRIWVGGRGAAPAVFDGTEFVAPPAPKLGPPVEAFSVDAITFGKRGNRWMGHTDGVFVTDGNVWQQAFGFRDRPARVSKIVFASENEGFLLAGGMIFRYEVASTSPTVWQRSSDGPPWEIEEVSTLNTNDYLHVRFRSQTSRALPGHMAYRYKIDGQPWRYTREQSISVPTPPVGTHRFLVEAIDPDLKHSPQLEIPVRIQADHRSFFITLGLLIAVALGCLQVVRLIRTRGEKARKQRELEETVSRRTAQIAAANEELSKRQAVSKVLSEVSSSFISTNPANIGNEIRTGLERVGRAIEAQRAHLYLAAPDVAPEHPDFHVDLAYQWFEEEVGEMSEQMHRIYPHRFPWVKERYFRGEPSIVLDPEELPDYAVAEKDLFKKMNWTSIGIVPLFVENRLVGSFGFSTYASPLSWSAKLVDELRIAGEIFANALERMNQNKALHDLRQDALDAEERERTRIARELHDQLGGALTGLKMHSRSLQEQLLEGEANPEQIERAQRISEIIDDTLPDVRRICAELRPAILDDLDLPQALQWQVDQFEKHTNIPCDLQISHDGFPDKEQNRDVAVYRITQELLTNVIRHSEASRVSISLERDNSDIVLRVSDNGKGIDMKELSKMPGRLGLRGIRERAEHFGGSISIVDTKGKGCTVEVRIPVDSAPLQEQGSLPLRTDQYSI